MKWSWQKGITALGISLFVQISFHWSSLSSHPSSFTGQAVLSTQPWEWERAASWQLVHISLHCLPASPSSSLSAAFLVIEIKTVLCHHTCVCFQIWISKACVQIRFLCITALQGLHLHRPFEVKFCLDFSPCHRNYVFIHVCQGGLKMYFPLSRPSMIKW